MALDVADDRLVGAFTPVEAIEHIPVAGAERRPCFVGAGICECGVAHGAIDAVRVENGAGAFDPRAIHGGHDISAVAIVMRRIPDAVCSNGAAACCRCRGA